MHIDRDLQRRALQACAEIYPKPADPMLLAQALGVDTSVLVATLAYLADHGLIACKVTVYQNRDDPPRAGPCVITARGLDFLEDDGGLTAILGTVTVKLHADTIRAMLLAKADASALPAPEKSALRKQIEALSGAALQEAAKRLTQEGLTHMGDVVHWIQGLMA